MQSTGSFLGALDASPQKQLQGRVNMSLKSCQVTDVAEVLSSRVQMLQKRCQAESDMSLKCCQAENLVSTMLRCCQCDRCKIDCTCASGAERQRAAGGLKHQHITKLWLT